MTDISRGACSNGCQFAKDIDRPDRACVGWCCYDDLNMPRVVFYDTYPFEGPVHGTHGLVEGPEALDAIYEISERLGRKHPAHRASESWWIVPGSYDAFA
jgi:hypothetical protein